MREHRAGGTLICHSSCHGPGAGAGGCCSGAPAGPSLLLGTGAEAPAVLSQCSVAAGSDPGVVAREKSASICHHERVAKLSPKLKMGLRDSPDRAGLEPLATMLEVSVLPPLEASQICCSKGGDSWSGVGTLGNFGCLLQQEPSQMLPDRLGDSILACKSCSDISGWSHSHVGLFGGDRKEL